MPLSACYRVPSEFLLGFRKISRIDVESVIDS